LFGMKTFKFLEDDGTSIWSATPWPLPTADAPGAWVVSREVRACRVGVHACRPGELAYWMRATMWEIELDGDVVEARHKVVAPRGRLLRRIDEYPKAVRELGAVAAWRTRDRAVSALRAEQRDRLADRFAGSETLAAIEALRPEVADDGSHGSQAALMAVDSAQFAPDGPIGAVPFFASNAAGYEADDFDAGFAAERRFQSEWLVERLGLDS
jgi:hypothetical protein